MQNSKQIAGVRAAMLPPLNLPTGGKQVQFEPTQKDTAIRSRCVQVPWAWYAEDRKKDYKVYNNPLNDKSFTRQRRIENKPNYPNIFYYLSNVLADPRLGKLKITTSIDQNPTDKPQVQIAALAAARAVPTLWPFANEQTRWVMEFVEDEDFGRYCLVPEDAMSAAERIDQAIAHLERSMTEETMANPKRDGEVNEQLLAYKNWNIDRLLFIKKSLKEA